MQTQEEAILAMIIFLERKNSAILLGLLMTFLRTLSLELLSRVEKVGKTI
jgi:hypothetical protein